jgi:hypothetical protein
MDLLYGSLVGDTYRPTMMFIHNILWIYRLFVGVMLTSGTGPSGKKIIPLYFNCYYHFLDMFDYSSYVKYFYKNYIFLLFILLLKNLKYNI